MLARLGRADPKLLSPVEHRGEQVQKDRALLQARDGYALPGAPDQPSPRHDQSLGVRVPKCSPTVFPRRVRETVTVDLFPGLPALLATIDQITAQLDGLEAEVKQLCRERYPEVVGMQEVGGVGPITALSYVLTVEDPARFREPHSRGVPGSVPGPAQLRGP